MKRRIVAGGVVALSMMALPVSPASAYTIGGSCSTGSYNLNGSASYSNSGPYHVWNMAYWNFNGPSLGGKNNMRTVLTSNGRQKWAWTSPDSMPAGTGHTGMNQVATLAGESEKISWTGVFDVPGFDPSCTANASL